MQGRAVPILVVGGACAAFLAAAGPSRAGSFTPSSQLRAVSSQTTDATTGYTCLSGGPGPPLPDCPIDLGTVVTSDGATAPDFAPYDETVATAGGQTAQTSSIGAASVTATGSASSTASATELTDPCCIFVLRTVDPDTENDFEVTVDLDAPTAFSFEASGWVEHPDPSFPVSGAASLDIELVGPGGSLGTLHASFDPGCSVQPSFGVCRVEPTPLSLSGTLPAGSYTIDVRLVTSAQGSWLPSTGPLGGFSSGAYDVTLTLEVPQVPGPGPGAAGLVAVLLGAFGAWGLRRRTRRA